MPHDIIYMWNKKNQIHRKNRKMVARGWEMEIGRGW